MPKYTFFPCSFRQAATPRGNSFTLQGKQIAVSRKWNAERIYSIGVRLWLNRCLNFFFRRFILTEISTLHNYRWPTVSATQTEQYSVKGFAVLRKISTFAFLE